MLLDWDIVDGQVFSLLGVAGKDETLLARTRAHASSMRRPSPALSAWLPHARSVGRPVRSLRCWS
eukprot:5103535-Prorocentrum_lima.AAC.1